MNLIKQHGIPFIIMIIVGMCFNPMNVLSYRTSDLYLSATLFYGGILMASNMVWSHEISHYFTMGHFNKYTFAVGVVLSVATTVFLLREQLFVTDEQWLKRMISHHSTALTTTHKIIKRTNNPKVKKLAREIITTQEKEITLMKSLVS
jgi:hypothetical protein